MHVVIFSGGKFTPTSLSDNLIKQADAIFAADSGANTAVEHRIFPWVVIGDMDSIGEKVKKLLEKKKVEFISFSQEKNETDTQLAVDYATNKGATQITILGGVEGTRLDHIIANVLLSCVYNTPIEFVNGNQIIRIEKGPKKVTMTGRKDDLLSLIPIQGNVKGITTSGLYYPLKNDELIFGYPQGISNVFLENTVEIIFEKGLLLFIHTLQM